MRRLINQLIFSSLCLFFALAFTSCYSHRAIGFMQDREDLPHYEKAEYEEYKLAVNDEVIYRLMSMDESISKLMNTGYGYGGGMGNQYGGQYGMQVYRVYTDGTVDMPFLDPIHVEGLTLRQAEDTIQAAMREVIPDATVKLALANRRFTVLGDIGSGTFYIYKERMTIFQALAMTGDVQQRGERRHVRIIRPQGDKEPIVLEFDLRTNTIIDSKYYWVYPNDVIYVARDKGSFYKVASYSAFTGLFTSSVSLLITVLNYTTTLVNYGR